MAILARVCVVVHDSLPTHTHIHTHIHTYTHTHTQLMQDHAGAVAIMSMAVNMDPSNSRLYLQLLDLYTSGPTHPDMAAAEALFSKVAGSAHLSEEVKESFLARRQQLLEEFGGNFAESAKPHTKIHTYYTIVYIDTEGLMYRSLSSHTV